MKVNFSLNNKRMLHILILKITINKTIGIEQ